MTRPRITPVVQALPATTPFVGPEVQERDRGNPFIARIGANESVFGPSPNAVAAMARAGAEAWMYGDSEIHDLRMALADHHAVDPQSIVVGEGIDGLLGYLVRLLVAAGDSVVTSNGAYPTFNYHVAGFGGILHKVPYKDDSEDLDSLIVKARETEAKLVYIANPDNPMGTWHDGAAVERMIAALPEFTVLALDEAYCDTAPCLAIPPMDTRHPRVIRFRTFSKAYGLAGLRVGYGIASDEFVSEFNKIRNHFGMGRVAQAGALAALADQCYLAQTVGRIAAARKRIAEIAAQEGLTSLPSATNFVAIDCGRDGAFAQAVLTSLLRQGIFVRMPMVAPQNRCIRVSCGTDADLDIFAAGLAVALQEAGGQ